MTPDVIVCWPRNCDYPAWRQFIRDNRDRFAKVLVVFTEHEGRDLSPFVRDNFPEAECFDSPPRGDRDWRDVAVNAALDRSDAEWVWFTEQDFLILRPKWFWGAIELAEDPLWARPWDAIGLVEPVSERWHPACLFVRRKTINATTRYFGTDPVDHFYAFGRELGRVFDLDYRWSALTAGRDYEHLQGTSQNHWLIDRGEDAGVFRRERFRQYLRDCLAVSVPLEEEWAAGARREISRG